MGIAEKYGAHYWQAGEKEVNTSRIDDLYSYKCYIGEHKFHVEHGDSAIFMHNDNTQAIWINGLANVESQNFAVVIRGYQCGEKAASLDQRVNLPYVNGCATRQIFPPERIGDPTLQQLTIPPYTSEQVHHIHPTARVVYVLKGQGWSIVGQSDETEETELKEGMVCVLDPMCPHHFRTEGEYLTVLPIHIFSSTPQGMEQNHPMFNGTREV